MNVQNTIVVNSNLGGLSFYEDETGKYVIGADSVPKRLGGVFCMDISIPDGRDKYVVNIENYIPNADIIGAGIINRSYHGWTGLSVTYTSKEVVFTFGLDGSRAVQSTGEWKARIWYI